VPISPLPEPSALSARALWRLGGATGTEDTEGPQFTELGGLAVGNGLLYVADAYGGVFTFDMAGGYEGVISAGEIMYITDVAVGPAGEVYIADAGLHQVTRFSAEHDLLGGFGAYGAGDGEFGSDGPAALAVGPGGEVFALDPNVDAAGAGLMRVQVFGPEGDFRRAFPAEPGPDAADLAVGPDGTLFIVSRQGYVAEVEPEAGRLIQRIGSAALDSGALVGAAFPQGIALDAAGNLFLTTQAPAAVAVLGATGHRLEARIGVETVRTEDGWPAGELFMPRGIAVTADGARVFVAESAAGFAYVTAFAR
jgi:DNA-binding beta-propeller fold protein YncE